MFDTDYAGTFKKAYEDWLFQAEDSVKALKLEISEKELEEDAKKDSEANRRDLELQVQGFTANASAIKKTFKVLRAELQAVDFQLDKFKNPPGKTDEEKANAQKGPAADLKKSLSPLKSGFAKFADFVKYSTADLSNSESASVKFIAKLRKLESDCIKSIKTALKEPIEVEPEITLPPTTFGKDFVSKCPNLKEPQIAAALKGFVDSLKKVDSNKDPARLDKLVDQAIKEGKDAPRDLEKAVKNAKGAGPALAALTANIKKTGKFVDSFVDDLDSFRTKMYLLTRLH